MTDNYDNIISIADWQKQKASRDQTTASPLQRYRAYEEHSQQKNHPMIKIERQDGSASVMKKSLLMEVQLSPEHLRLLFTSCLITIKGSSLDKLLEPFQYEQIHILRCFDPHRHEPLTDQEIIIASISTEKFEKELCF